MAQFDVYKNTNLASKKAVPYLLDVQNELFSSLSTRMVVPLVSEKRIGKPMSRLNPCFDVNGKTVYMSCAEMAGVSHSVLGECVTSLGYRRSEIVDALDFLIAGF